MIYGRHPVLVHGGVIVIVTVTVRQWLSATPIGAVGGSVRRTTHEKTRLGPRRKITWAYVGTLSDL